MKTSHWVRGVSMGVAVVWFLALAQFAYGASYEIFLYKRAEDGYILPDKDSSVTVQESALDAPPAPASGKFFAEFYAVDTQLPLARYAFADPTTPGKFTLRLPYYPTANKIAIKIVGAENTILTFDTTAFVTCNNNGICESSLGEGALTCPKDCSAPATSSDVSPDASASPAPSDNVSAGGLGISGWIGLIIGALVILIIIIVVIRKMVGSKEEPPTLGGGLGGMPNIPKIPTTLGTGVTQGAGTGLGAGAGLGSAGEKKTLGDMPIAPLPTQKPPTMSAQPAPTSPMTSPVSPAGSSPSGSASGSPGSSTTDQLKFK